MANMASSARDIPKAFGRDSLTAVEARSILATNNHPLPTPPNSISPSLPPHAMKPYGPRSTNLHVPENVDSDIDLQDGQGSEQDNVVTRGRDMGSPGFEAAGNITPHLLARHHLPEILLNHGPLAIRHIMGFLSTAVPGFSGIPPAKARRLVVGALEGRGSGGEGGGVKGNVKFEKVGWGRWDARLKGHPARSSKGGNRQTTPPSAPSSYSHGMPIAQNGGWKAGRDRLHAPESSWAGDSAAFSHDDDAMMLENEADKMSLDGDSCSSSEALDDDFMDDDDLMTDEEDWAAVGAAALRAASYSASAGRRTFLSPHIRAGTAGKSLLSTIANFMPGQTSQCPAGVDFAAFGMTSDSQERDAVEALLQLGSV
ncbi:related to STB3 SIN3 protein-binding protein [Rhynchosporium secalis]|uniref:Related to STB3 SIN3 protein-binding protein n=1 Tax=Rhynchosporium secalis TaxID=38038 RepID=A0A1E1MKT0_RHYSE|nr:related to STB3 SIN3 protein-binding protein [Rhynchosporium secalis]